MNKLTDKQKKFVKEYLIDLNATQAAIRAGYSDKVAKEIGYENLTKPHIKKEIDKEMDKREKRTEITQDMVLKQLAKIAFADIKDIMEYKTAKTVVGYEDGEPIIDYKAIIDLKDSNEVDGTLITEVQETRDGLKVKRNDPLKALELLGRHLGMFTDKIEHTGKDGGPIEIVKTLTDEELEREIKKLSTSGGN